MIPFSDIFYILKTAQQFLTGNICYKCLDKFRPTYDLVYGRELLSLSKQKKYTSLPLPLRFHIEECLTLVYHLILFLEEILQKIVGPAPAITSTGDIDFFKEIKSTIALPNLAKEEKQLAENVVDFLLELRAAKVIPTHTAVKNTLVKTLQLKRDTLT